MSVNSAKVANHLINENSPYLLQHAYNPVNWYPWGKEAFDRAIKEDKPVFLSIGYSTCHWCHVMEGESFEQLDVAKILNDDFISIKVDKEERPDIDSIYMKVCQAFTGQGGWPLTILMTPEQKPFYAATYLPKNSRYSMIGLIDLLQAVSDNWKNNKTKLLHSSEEVTNMLKEQNNNKHCDISKDMINEAFNYFQHSFDKKYGGFGSSPKFPTPHNLLYLLRYYYFEHNNNALSMVDKTLQQMYKGGIFDHIGFGFSRYSTDEKWLVPHFEKMLYDNALLVIAFLETYQLTKNELYKNIAIETLAYVKRELTDKDGGFYCAQDADSEGVEGKYYVFTPDEITEILGDDSKYFDDYFDITKQGNFEGKSIPNLIDNDNFATSNALIEQLSKKVLEYRSKRTFLHKDDKILTSWNALMIIAYTKAYKILGEKEYLATAKTAVSFIEENLVDKQGNLYVSYRNGKISSVGNIDDYAFLIWAYLELYDATFDGDFLEKALNLNEAMIQRFWDEENGGFFIYGSNSERLICRPKELYDGAIPSGNSVAAYCLVKLAKLTGNLDLNEKSQMQLSYIAGNIADFPAGYCFFLMGAMQEIYSSQEIVIVANSKSDFEPIARMLGQKFLPNTVLLAKVEDKENLLESLCEFVKEYKLMDNDVTFYMCQNNTCSPPFHGIDELAKKLDSSVIQKV